MYDYNKPFGESCYRLMSRTGSFIYLKTRGYLEIDKDTNKVHSFVCINTLVSEEEGKRMVSEMKRKFSIIIDPEATIPESGDANSEEHMSVENPLQIERAIMNLITNLESSGSSVVAPSSSGSNCTGTPPRPKADDVARRAIEAAHGGAGSSDARSTHSPPLAIIAPRPSTIKPSVTKTMEVITGKRPLVQTSDDSDDSDEDEEEAVAGRTGRWAKSALVMAGSGSSRSGRGQSVIETTQTTTTTMNTSRPSVVVHRTTSTTSRGTTERDAQNSFTGSAQGIVIKPELRDCSSLSDGGLVDQGMDLNYYSSYPGPSSAGHLDQLLGIKQEVSSCGDLLLHSPASSTVSSMSNEQLGSSNGSSSTNMAGGGISSSGSGGSGNVRHKSVIAPKRSDLHCGIAGEGGSARKRQRRSSRSLDDIPDVGPPSMETTDSTNNSGKCLSQ